MPTSWTRNYYHAVFSTKHRAEVITPEIEERLYPFLGGILKDLKCTALAINGMPDHVHVLVRYPANLSHADMLKHLKGRSSLWLGETFPHMAWRGWQEGYGGFTVSHSIVERNEAYVRGQKAHHLKQTFREEVVELLQFHGMEFVDEEVFG